METVLQLQKILSRTNIDIYMPFVNCCPFRRSGIGGDGMAWYVVDSKADAPEIIGSAAELALHLGMEAREHQGHVFVVSDGECEVMAGDGGRGGGGDIGKEEEKTAGGL